jgi:hypothetical protein
LELLDLKETLDQQVRLELQVHKVVLDIMAQTVLMATQDLKVQLDHKGTLGLKEI